MIGSHFEKINELIDDAKIAYLCTHADGRIAIHPMAVITDYQADGLWFLTLKSSAKIKEIEANDEVSLLYDKNAYVVFEGQAKISQQLVKIKQLWTPEIEAMFNCGADSGKVALIQVVPRLVRYWEEPGPYSKTLNLD